MGEFSVIRSLVVTVLLVLVPVTGSAEDRGRMLYENHCVACHESTVHIREAHKVRTYADLEQYTRRFAKQAGVDWSDDEMFLVVEYLNRTRYKLEPKP